MRILHTSDWHIGKTLFGQKRYNEHENFLQWLSDTIQEKHIDALLVSGDIFDTSTPGNRAQELYYKFLCRIAQSSCSHVVITAGNHDSPTFLEAPKELLKTFNIYVLGTACENIADEVLELKNKNGETELIVCAVPYLRERDIRIVENDESIDDKENALTNAITLHYETVCDIAEKKRNAINKDIPIVCMGHLLTSGGETITGDGVRELYIGTLAHITASIFPKCIDYLALGHIHVPQIISGLETMRYSGSPIPIGFSELNHKKSVCMVEFTKRTPLVTLLNIPLFQKLENITGNWEHIQSRILEHKTLNSDIWLEINYEGDDIIADLREHLEDAITDTKIKILRVKNKQAYDKVLGQIDDECLDDLSVNDVFERCMDINNIPQDYREELLNTYLETLNSLYEEDKQAE